MKHLTNQPRWALVLLSRLIAMYVRVFAPIGSLLLCATTAAQTRGDLTVVADRTSPVTITKVLLERTSTGIVLNYSIVNGQNDAVKGIVLTAAALDSDGKLVHIHMLQLQQRVPARASAEHRAEFDSVELSDAHRIIVGVQAVQGQKRRAEWRGTLRLTSPVALAEREVGSPGTN